MHCHCRQAKRVEQGDKRLAPVRNGGMGAVEGIAIVKGQHGTRCISARGVEQRLDPRNPVQLWKGRVAFCPQQFRIRFKISVRVVDLYQDQAAWYGAVQ